MWGERAARRFGHATPFALGDVLSRLAGAPGKTVSTRRSREWLLRQPRETASQRALRWARDRCHLERLDERLLRDIGLTEDDLRGGAPLRPPGHLDHPFSVERHP